MVAGDIAKLYEPYVSIDCELDEMLVLCSKTNFDFVGTVVAVYDCMDDDATTTTTTTTMWRRRMWTAVMWIA